GGTLRGGNRFSVSGPVRPGSWSAAFRHAINKNVIACKIETRCLKSVDARLCILTRILRARLVTWLIRLKPAPFKPPSRGHILFVVFMALQFPNDWRQLWREKRQRLCRRRPYPN